MNNLDHICSVAGLEDIAAVRLLRDGLAVHHPDATLTVVALPGARRALEAIGGLETLTLDDLDLRTSDGFYELLPSPVLAALARPLVLTRVLAKGARTALLLAPDCELRGRLDALEEALEHSEAVMLARTDGQLPDDGERPDAGDLLEAGELDDEIVAVREGAGAARLLAWWLDHAVYRVPEASAPGRLRTAPSPLHAFARAREGVVVLEDKGYGVSAWNLFERPLSVEGEAISAADRPLRLMRFAGFRPDRPWWLSGDSTRSRVLGDPVLTRLCRERSDRLAAAGWTPPAGGNDVRAELACGLRLDERLRRLLGVATDDGEDFGSLTEAAGAIALLGWLGEPSPGPHAHGLNRYVYDVWASREDLRRAYPQPGAADAEGFVGWLWVHGRKELNLDARLLPPAPDWTEGVLQTVPSVQVLGYMRGSLGLGQAARGYAAALRASGVPVGTHTVPLDGPLDDRGATERRLDELAYEDEALDEDAEALLVCVNAPQLPGLIADVGEEAFTGRYVIGQWGWETDAIPAYWNPSFDLVDEIWVYSSYVAEVIAAVSPKPVVAVPLPVERPREIATDHGLALPDGDFTFLFAFDFLSTLQRKNPDGLIEAFKLAFRPGDGPRLVLKTTNARFRPELLDRLRYAIGDRTDLAIVDASLQPAELAALFLAADCYVSLHRSEGFGLTLAESMVLGKPVIATAFGGNLDFMRPSNSHLVDYMPTHVGPDGEHYPAEGSWAEPSVEHAAELMREVWSDRDAARELGEQARQDIELQLSTEAVGAIARRRLLHLPSRRKTGQAAPEAPYPINELERRLEFDLAPEGGASPRDAAKRAALRAMRPYTVAERRLDEALVVSVRHLYGQLERLQAERERDRDRIARLERRLRRGGE